jgi:hypothetical protein
MRMPFRRFMAWQQLAFKRQIENRNLAARAEWERKNKPS